MGRIGPVQTADFALERGVMSTPITAAMVNELRKRTDLPMMECKSALQEAGGDMEKAVDIICASATRASATSGP